MKNLIIFSITLVLNAVLVAEGAPSASPGEGARASESTPRRVGFVAWGIQASIDKMSLESNIAPTTTIQQNRRDLKCTAWFIPFANFLVPVSLGATAMEVKYDSPKYAFRPEAAPFLSIQPEYTIFRRSHYALSIFASYRQSWAKGTDFENNATGFH
ncbi:MAG: hypothetical protein HQL31_01880, partial [Planctomycetes bacterium]|nr:hypothetical protein [Planctomycetota bacterium]